MEFTYYGHACFSVKMGGKHILFDPFITGNPLAGDVDIDSIPADYIFVSHGHQDHLLDLNAIALRTGARIVSNYEIITWLSKQGITGGHGMNHGGKHAFEFGLVKYVNAVHSSSFPDGTYAGNPGGFVLSGAEGTFYYSGDTALTMDMQLIPEFFSLDFAVLPVGDNLTMGYEEALRAAQLVKTKRVIGVHYDTFEAIRLDKDKAREYFQKAGRELLLPQIGETISLEGEKK